MITQAEKKQDDRQKPEKSGGIFFFYKRIFFYFKKHIKLAIPLALITIAMISYTSIIPLITKAIFDDALANKDLHLFMILLSVLIFGLVLLVVLWIASDILQALIGVKISNDLRLGMFKKVHHLTHVNYRENTPGDLLHRFENCTIVTYVLTQVACGAIGNLLFIMISAGIMIYLNWQISILVFMIMPMTFYCANKIAVLAERQFMIKGDDDAKLFHMAREDIDFHAFLPILRLRKYRIKQYKQQLGTFEKKDFLYNTYLLLTNTAIAAGIVFLQLLIIALGSYLVFTGYLTMGSFVAFLTMYATFSYAINALGASYPALIRAAHGLMSIDELLLFHTDNEEKKILPGLTRLSKSIRFNHVDFNYTKGQGVLRDITMEILAGESVAIIGPSGAGKSTLLDLLLRQEMPISGKIEFDGKNIWAYSEDSLFSQIGIVPRNPGLFLMSISDNIRMGKLDATEGEIIAAAKAAEIHEEIVSLPNGYNTLAVWGGANLSSGQMQRIVLARALVGNPAILILDEATSYLDAYNQDAINATLRKQSGQRTAVVITHHLKEVIDFEKIILLDKGQIVEVGNHKELLKLKGKYYELWKKQTGVHVSHDRENIQIKLSWLRNIPLFEKFDDELLNFCVHNFMIEEVPSDQIVFEEGTVGKKFYIIANGSVSVSQYDDIRQEKNIAILENGDFFGEIALLHTLPRTARVVTLGTCTFLVLHQDQFSEVFNRLPADVREAIQKTARERLKNVKMI